MTQDDPKARDDTHSVKNAKSVPGTGRVEQLSRVGDE